MEWIHAANGKPVLSYEVRLDNRILEVFWEPDISLDEGAEGVRAVTRLIEQYGCAGVLTDTSRNTLDWSELIPMLQYEEFPRSVAAGLRFQASVVAPNPMDTLAHQELHEETMGLLHTRFFWDVEPARAWLEEVVRGEAE